MNKKNAKKSRDTASLNLQQAPSVVAAGMPRLLGF